MNGMHGIIFSYEKRNDLRELGEIRSASSIPFGGRYRAVDFALSNLVNAGVTDVGVVLHGHYQSLLDHLGTGKDWDLSRKRGGLKILPPFAYKQHWGEAAVFRGKIAHHGNGIAFALAHRQFCHHPLLSGGDPPGLCGAYGRRPGGEPAPVRHL